jgi:uncharacterized protein (DUF1800 family)
MYGPTPENIEQSIGLGLDGSIAKLMEEQPLPDMPINAFTQADPAVSLGETWVGKVYTRGDDLNKIVNGRLQSINAWTMGNLIHEGFSIREKMTLFWHNHFVTSDIRDATFIYLNITKYRKNHIGNFRELVKLTTIDPSMLRYLNGNQNTKNKPNENYARELLELFTIGKGPLVGDGDYTTYTEDDILAISKILTGWRDTGYLKVNDRATEPAIFLPNQHDTSIKKLSPRFNNVEIGNLGAEEYAHLIDIIFLQEEVSKFIARKLYRWFVYYDIDQNIEDGIIVPMAKILRDHDYEVKPMIEALLKSQHFYDEYAIGAMIKNPLDFIVGEIKQLKLDFGQDLYENYAIWNRLGNFSEILQMAYFKAPSVAGWKAYYQPPLYYRSWINSTTLSSRLLFSGILINGVVANRLRIQADLLQVVADIDGSNDPNKLIDMLAQIFLPKEISSGQKDYLKSLLIPGLPDYEWTLEYDQHRSNPDDNQLKNAVETRLKTMFYGLISLPEFQLS